MRRMTSTEVCSSISKMFSRNSATRSRVSESAFNSSKLTRYNCLVSLSNTEWATAHSIGLRYDSGLIHIPSCKVDDSQLSNIADRGYLGPEATLTTFGPLLKRSAENPNATLVTLFLNAVHEVYSPLDRLDSIGAATDRLRKYLPLTREMFQQSNSSDPDLLRFIEAQTMFRDFDELFKRFMHECRFDEISKATGLKMKSGNTIVRPWPMRLKKKGTQREFELLHASGHNGSERYVEWKSSV